MNEVLRKVEELNDKISSFILFQKENLTFEEGCLYTNRSRSNMYKLTSQRKIPHYKDGRFIWFKRTELDQWLLRNPVKTTQEIESEAATYVAMS